MACLFMFLIDGVQSTNKEGGVANICKFGGMSVDIVQLRSVVQPREGKNSLSSFLFS